VQIIDPTGPCLPRSSPVVAAVGVSGSAGF
jgi:hypothetical protein